MSLPSPAVLLRHRPPALVLGTIEAFTGRTLSCFSRAAGPWLWPEILEGAAQAGGLLAGLQPSGPSPTAVIAEYRNVVIHAPAHAGLIRFEARLDRRLLHFWRCRVQAWARDRALLLEGLVTIAPGA